MRALFCLAVLLLSGCSGKNLPEYTQLGGLRVLALSADTPEVSPGATVTVTPLVTDILGVGRSLTYSAVGCTDPGIAYGASPTCDGAADAVTLGAGSFAPASPRFTENAPTFSATVPANYLALRGDAQQFNGTPYLVTYTISASSGEQVRSFRRILVSSSAKSAKNQNPGTPTLMLNDAEIGALPASAQTVSNQISGTGAETYSFVDNNGVLQTQPETLTTTWFSSDGSFSRYRTEGSASLTYTPPTSAPTTHAVVLVLVVRDDRGGVNAKIYGF